MTTAPTESSAAFPDAPRGRKGYERAAVDEFLLRARSAFEASSDDPITAADVRKAAFPLTRRGYSIEAVDAALGRIEDAFAARERHDAITTAGAGPWVGQARETAQAILDRLARGRRRRFDRVSALRFGYRVDEVDIVADRISRYLETGESLTPEQVRSVAFRMQRRGYREAQVDAVLDAVIEVMLAVA
ncbi:DivIVA domain-containing protein [Microbacterium sp. BWT-B31]|uniref:DivIVA domain-containing protein n=1 Tax=Microbacterium sp. BWT-B31 TaxID=3232072 RepID=UPI003529902F